MNSTFMFGEDRFGPEQNFYEFYQTTGGGLSRNTVERIIRLAYNFLDERYPDPEYRERFPSLEEALRSAASEPLDEQEIENLTATFAFHELGEIPSEYAVAIRALARQYTLGAVIDIWAPKLYWLAEFKRVNVLPCFATLSFSSEIRAVKPSPLGFLNALKALGTSTSETIVIGDSVRRDLGGAQAAGLNCILVGGATDPRAYGTARNLLDLVNR